MRRDYSMLTAEELRLLRLKRRRIVLAISLLLLIGVAVFFAARPARSAIKGWQARRHAHNAFAFIHDEKWKEARDEAIAAYQLRQTEPEALRALARFLSRTRQPQAFEFWDQLAQQQPLTREDRRDEAAVALTIGELARAAAAVEFLLADEGKEATPQDWLLAAQLSLQRGAANQALDSLGKFFLRSDATARERFQATLLQLQAARTGNVETDQKNQAEAWRRLSEMATGSDSVALDVLVILARRQLTISAANEGKDLPNLFPRDELIQRLESHPLAKAPQKLLAFDLRLQAEPNEESALLTKAIGEFKDSEPADLAVLATWLNGKGEYERQLAEIPLERALNSRDLFLQHVDALGALSRWDEIRRLLESERFPLDPVIEHMYLARCSAQLGNEAAAANNWQRALESAGGDPGKLILLADYAEKNGALETAAAAYDTVVAQTPGARAAQQGRLRVAQAERDTEKIHAILADFLMRWPIDIAVQNDEAYTRLLLLSPNESTNSEQLISIEKIAEELVRLEPASLPHRTLLALALLKQGRPVAALEVYHNLQVAPNALSPGALAIHAAILAANDQRGAAEEELSHVPLDKLLKEEAALITSLRVEK